VLDGIEYIKFKSQGKINQLMNKLTDDSGIVAASLRTALGANACHAARAAISAGGFHFGTSADGIGMWDALLTYIKTPTAQLIAHTALNMEWTACIQGDDETLSVFVTRFAMLVNRFKALGRELSESEIMTHFDLKVSVDATATAVTAGTKSWADIQTAVSAKSTTDTARQLLRDTPRPWRLSWSRSPRRRPLSRRRRQRAASEDVLGMWPEGAHPPELPEQEKQKGGVADVAPRRGQRCYR